MQNNNYIPYCIGLYIEGVASTRFYSEILVWKGIRIIYEFIIFFINILSKFEGGHTLPSLSSSKTSFGIKILWEFINLLN